MDQNFTDSLEHLKTINLEIRQRLELAEARINSANALLEQLAATQLANERIYMGDVVLCRPYSEQFEQTGYSQLVQAALSIPRGYGAVFWDSEELAALEGTQQLRLEAICRHVHFNQCAPAIKALLLPQFEGLLSTCLRDLDRLWST